MILDLFSNNISGEIPIGLGDIKNLKVISFSDNKINGIVPEALGKLKSLERLELADNQIQGGLPAAIGELSNLSVLVLAENRLTGNFPTTVFSLPGLRVLQLQNNDFDKKHLRNSIPLETDLALFEFDDIQDRKNRKDFNRLYSDTDIRTADTKFEDDN